MNPQKILIVEWFLGGGANEERKEMSPSTATNSSPGGVLRQAEAMLMAVCEDFSKAGLEVSVPINVNHLNRKNWRRLNEHQAIIVHPVSDLEAFVKVAANDVDTALIIAPETEGRLFRWCNWFAQRKLRVLNSSLEMTMLASNKNQLQSILNQHTVGVPMGLPAEIWISGNHWLPTDTNLLLKPTDGCGGEGQRFVQSPDDLLPIERDALHRWRVEAWVEGTPVSVSCVGNGQSDPTFLPALRQCFLTGPPGAFSHCVDDLSPELQHRARTLAEQASAALPGFNRMRGFLGIDMVLGNCDVVIEVNPRITMSYCMLRNKLDFNLADRMLPPT